MNIKYFTYYYDIINDITFIDREIYELCKKYEIDLESIPRILYNKNYYSIEEDKLKEFIEKSNYIGNRVLLLVDNKSIKRKNKQLTICKCNNELFVPEEVKYVYKAISNNKLIKVNGEIYIKITEEDLNHIKKAYLRKDINIEDELKLITPIKK